MLCFKTELLRFLANDATPCNPEPELRGCCAGGGWGRAVFTSSGPSVLPARFKRWPVKVGADGVVMIGIGAEDSRLPTYLCVGQKER